MKSDYLICEYYYNSLFGNKSFYYYKKINNEMCKLYNYNYNKPIIFYYNYYYLGEMFTHLNNLE